MIFQLQNDDKKVQLYASYKIGNDNKSIKVKFDLKIPGDTEFNLVPMLSTVELMDKNLNVIKRESQETPDIKWTKFSTEEIIEYGNLYFQTNFVVNGNVSSNEELEKYFKKCKTTYSVGDGEDGLKKFTMFDNILIAQSKKEVFLTKRIILNS